MYQSNPERERERGERKNEQTDQKGNSNNNNIFLGDWYCNLYNLQTEMC